MRVLGVGVPIRFACFPAAMCVSVNFVNGFTGGVSHRHATPVSIFVRTCTVIAKANIFSDTTVSNKKLPNFHLLPLRPFGHKPAPTRPPLPFSCPTRLTVRPPTRPTDDSIDPTARPPPDSFSFLSLLVLRFLCFSVCLLTFLCVPFFGLGCHLCSWFS